jgi:hypothetical protein
VRKTMPGNQGLSARRWSRRTITLSSRELNQASPGASAGLKCLATRVDEITSTHPGGEEI